MQEQTTATEYWMYQPLNQLANEYHQNGKLLPNFTQITHEDKDHINKFRINLFSMILQCNRSTAKRDFHSYYSYLQPEEVEMQKKIYQNYPEEGRDAQICLNIYSYDAYVNKVINNTLRGCYNPLKTTYIRLIFYDLFWSIKSIYDKSHKNQRYILYRGGVIKDEELSSIKEARRGFIEMQGFLSTSLDRQKAEFFAQNVLFQIHVNDKVRDVQSDFGFCDIMQYSEFPIEQQYLFNALNVFKILNVEFIPEKNWHIITMEYGSLAQCVYKNKCKQKLQDEEKVLVFNYEYHLKQKERVLCQGDTLFEMSQYTKALAYYENKLRLQQEGQLTLSKNEQKLMYFNMGKIYSSNGEWEKAQTYFKRIIEVSREGYWINKANQGSAQMFRIVNENQFAYHHYFQCMRYYERTAPYTLAHIEIAFLAAKCYYYFKGTFHGFRYSIEPLCQIVLNYHKVSTYQYARILMHMAFYYVITQQPDKQLDMYQKAKNIIEDIIGYDNYQIVSIYRYFSTFYIRRSQFPLALKYLQKSKYIIDKLDREKKCVHLNCIYLAYIYAKMERIEEAETLVSHQNFVRGGTFQKTILLSLKSLILYKKNQHEESIQVMKEAMKQLKSSDIYSEDFTYKVIMAHAKKLNLA